MKNSNLLCQEKHGKLHKVQTMSREKRVLEMAKILFDQSIFL